jgi:ribonuclease P protein component
LAGAESGFPKGERLRKRQEYVVVQRRGKRFHTPWFVVVWAPGPAPWPRLGITASKKVGPAVARNRAKRLVREAFRHNKGMLPVATDIVIIASPATARASYQEVEAALLAWARHVARATASPEETA